MANERGSVRPSRFRSLVLTGLGIIFVLFLGASGIAQLFTDWWWFDSIGHPEVFSTILGTRLALAALFSAFFALVIWVNLYLADRVAPTTRVLTPEEDLIERYHEIIGENGGRLRVLVAGALGLLVGLNTSQQWETWLLFRNGGDFGVVDPLFGKDAGFYVFRLPFWSFLVGWIFATLVFALLLTLVAHYLNGGIRAAAIRERVTPAVKLHVSVLLALLAVTRAVSYYLDRFELVNGNRGQYDGALATDVKVQLPALNLLAVISLFGAALFVANIRRKGWGLPVVALGVWLLSHIVVGGMWPAIYQRFRVEVDESTREREYIGFNIEATRYAYGLDDEGLRTEEFLYSDDLDASIIDSNQDILDDVAILDRDLAVAPFRRVEGDLQAFDFASRLDVDRYEIGGETEPVVLGVRELDLSSFTSWEARHVAMTHGYGVAVAAADSIDGGRPDFLVSGLGSDQKLGEGFEGELDQPQIYYSEGIQSYALVGATRDEVDYPSTTEATFRYDGDGGVAIDSVFRKAMFALRFQQYQPVISPFLDDETKIIYNRDINLRVRELAPFLEFDSDPYPVLSDGKVYWVIDAYTTTSQFPYSQQVSTNSFAQVAFGDPVPDLRSGYNYVRNSVKAVVGAYDGDVSFYVVDDQDPMIAAYQNVFPDLFAPVSEAPAGIEAHFRYPTDLFKVQTDVWAEYQVDDPIQFLEGALAWQVSKSPSRVGTVKDDEEGVTQQTISRLPMEPQYRTTRLPGSTETEFVLQRMLEPKSGDSNTRPELRSIMMARAAEGGYELVQYRLSDAEVDLPSPILADQAIRADSVVSNYIILRKGRVQFGEIQLVRLDDTVVYVRPLYVSADSETAPPELRQVVVFSGGNVSMAPTLAGAIDGLTGSITSSSTGNTGGNDDGGDTATPSIPSSINLDGLSASELIGLIDGWLDGADVADANGENETAAELRANAREGIAKLSEILGVEPKVPTIDEGGA